MVGRGLRVVLEYIMVVRDLSLDELRRLLDPVLDVTTWAEFRAHLPA